MATTVKNGICCRILAVHCYTAFFMLLFFCLHGSVRCTDYVQCTVCIFDPECISGQLCTKCLNVSILTTLDLLSDTLEDLLICRLILGVPLYFAVYICTGIILIHARQSICSLDSYSRHYTVVLQILQNISAAYVNTKVPISLC